MTALAQRPTPGLGRPAPARRPWPRPAALPATLAMVLLLATGRWGSYVHVPDTPLFLTDVLLGLAAGHLVSQRLLRGPARRPLRLGLGHLLCALLVAYAAVRLLAGQQHNLTALRDAVPYLYGFVALLSAVGYARSDAAGRARTARLLHIALLLHLAWMLPSRLIGEGLSASMPALSDSTYLFAIRPDVDAALLSVLAGFSALRLLGGQARLMNAAICLLSATLALSVQSRAAALAVGAVAVLVLVAASADRRRNLNSRVLVASAVPVILLGLVLVIPQTEPGRRLVATVVPSAALGGWNGSTAGTTRARVIVWTTVTDYTRQSGGRAAFGVGFGPDFLKLTGTDQIMGSRTFRGVRSPHNYLVGTFARLGVFGLLLVSTLLAAAGIAIWRARSRIAGDDLLALCAMTVVAIVPIAMVGVVLESPFGAVPLFWCCGILFARWLPQGEPDPAAAGGVAR